MLRSLFIQHAVNMRADCFRNKFVDFPHFAALAHPEYLSFLADNQHIGIKDLRKHSTDIIKDNACFELLLCSSLLIFLVLSNSCTLIISSAFCSIYILLIVYTNHNNHIDKSMLSYNSENSNVNSNSFFALESTVVTYPHFSSAHTSLFPFSTIYPPHSRALLLRRLLP